MTDDDVWMRLQIKELIRLTSPRQGEPDVSPKPVDTKFIVFKRDEFLAWQDAKNHGVSPMTSLQPVDDAVVIRRQDVFAPPALDAYANMILAAISLHADSGTYLPGVDGEPESVKALREIADYFHEQATLAWDTNRKVPD